MITICRFSPVSSTGPETSENGDIHTLFMIRGRRRKLNCMSIFTSLRKHSFSYTTGHNFFQRLTVYLLCGVFIQLILMHLKLNLPDPTIAQDIN